MIGMVRSEAARGRETDAAIAREISDLILHGQLARDLHEAGAWTDHATPEPDRRPGEACALSGASA